MMKSMTYLVLSDIVQEAVDLLLSYSYFLSAFQHLYTAPSVFPLVASALAKFMIEILGKQFIQNPHGQTLWMVVFHTGIFVSLFLFLCVVRHTLFMNT